jgi:uncharacterized damage-inducible protein DinB
MTQSRTFGWSDMWTDPESDPRESGGPYAGERETLVRYLRDRRLTLVMKCADLDAEGMAQRSVPPSNMSLLGLVRHLADVEQYWFRDFVAGENVEPHYTSTNVAFDEATADQAAIEDAWRTWRSEIEYAERLMAETPDMGMLSKDGETELRDVVMHVIEEYARHNGHADLIRERIDGRVGQ